MRCKDAQKLFDAYLDGELSPSLAAELGAHQLQCPRCRRELALLEVTGHILSSDPEDASLGDDFAERLLACLEQRPPHRRLKRVQRWLYIGVPLAAAAVIALAFIGVFNPETRVAGKEEFMGPALDPDAADVQATGSPDLTVPKADASFPDQRSAGAMASEDGRNLTVWDFLDAIEQAAGPSGTDEGKSAAEDDPASTSDDQTGASEDDVEDL
jgi:anti-sigma factor RsiW